MTNVEKRWSPRNSLVRKVSVAPHDGPFDRWMTRPSTESCWSKDISKGGIRLETKRAFKANSILKLNFQFMDKRSVDVFAKVVWSKADLCGLKFMAFGGGPSPEPGSGKPMSLRFSRRIDP